MAFALQFSIRAWWVFHYSINIYKGSTKLTIIMSYFQVDYINHKTLYSINYQWSHTIFSASVFMSLTSWMIFCLTPSSFVKRVCKEWQHKIFYAGLGKTWVQQVTKVTVAQQQQLQIAINFKWRNHNNPLLYCIPYLGLYFDNPKVFIILLNI